MPPGFDLQPEERAARLVRQRAYIEGRLRGAVAWSDTITWRKELTIKARTYHPRRLFDVPAVPLAIRPEDLDPQGVVISQDKLWLYAHKKFPKGELLRTVCGSRVGDVCFDGAVVIPCLHNRLSRYDSWNISPFMSLTPMEMLSLRSGTRLARGRVVVAGLGIGHQLLCVLRKPSVTEVTLVELSPDLVEFVLPAVRLQPEFRDFMLRGGKFNVVVGDAREVLPELTADVALVDIFKSYGHNALRRRVLTGIGSPIETIICPSIGRVWCWGASDIGY